MSTKKKVKAKAPVKPIVEKIDDGLDTWIKPSKAKIRLNRAKATIEAAKSLGWKREA